MCLLLIVCLLVFAKSSTAAQPRDLHGVNGKFDTRSLHREAPDSDPSANPGYTLNPEWSHDSQNHAPNSLDPISPFNDNGRSQMVDNFLPAPWMMNCPALALDCSRCPRDLRCSRTLLTTKTPPHNGQITPQPAGLGGYNTITGQQDSDTPTVAGQQPPPCPLQKCSNAGAPPCGPGAICRKDNCACLHGRKGHPFGPKGWMALRGWTWPEALNIFVNPGVPCETPCDTLFCGEVRGRGCDGPQSLQPGSLDSIVSEAIVAQENSTSVVPSFQSLGIETLISTLKSKLATSAPTPLGQIVSTSKVVPGRSYVSHVSAAIPQSTGERPMGAIPTRSATNDDFSLPMAPGGMGAIQKPGAPPLRF
ncbi:uncharacterized protein CC84DRAFT_1227319 [Paraphaeosphaeria sporulosa]|uniref:Uncharacterized protein n=1 Tax=Paraphaeosphaeria sporulosa TaxID=1460663 RepID=A0A177CYV7_9PLEO|nr:uncharacterized protein CC84DRAFT_1227319 [Paraphaeosphaeria sporulosa]OAG12735.1 hypothetical protein CC84DRAFT_1227319 [Paraphaeosphaeria sporulosa]